MSNERPWGGGEDEDPVSIEERFWEFHLRHPEVYVELKRRALDFVQRRGRAHLGIGMLWEVLRYFTMLGAEPDEEAYRLNNNYRAHYARLLMEQEPELAEVFATRKLRSKRGQ